MRTTRRQGTTRRLGARAAAVALAAAGLCAPAVAPHAGAATSSRSSARLVISTAKSARFGTILVSGTTVYTLKPNGVACTAKCLKYWPEVLLPKGAAHATAGPGVDAAKLGTIKARGTPAGDLRRQGALLVLQGHGPRSGEGQRQGHVGQVVGRRDQARRLRLDDDDGPGRRRRGRRGGLLATGPGLGGRHVHCRHRSILAALGGAGGGGAPLLARGRRVARLPAGGLDRGRGGRPDRHRLVEPLGRDELRRRR